MRRRRALAAAIVPAVVTALVVAGASDAGKARGTVRLSAELRGENEIPPADPGGSGTARVRLNTKEGRVCFRVSFTGIGRAIMGHIHQGGPDVNGDIRVPFFEVSRGLSSPVSDCVRARRSLLRRIANRPGGWYVNVHTAEFPNGAIRGQLARSGTGRSGGGGSGAGGTGGGGGGGYPGPR
jgi:CHRD domain